MKNILDSILEYKVQEVKEFKKMYTHDKSRNSKPSKDFSLIKQLESSDTMQVIAEIKRGSPSKGLFAPDLDILAQSSKYNSDGASAISVLTDKRSFFGGFEDIEKIRPNVNLPILCKDFIIDEIQIDIAKSIGANLILLIVAAHPLERLRELLDYSKSMSLEVLVEVHNKEELDIALQLNHSLIGVNNRNLKTFKTDLQVSLDLIKNLDTTNLHFISESGIKTKEDVVLLSEAGFKGVLVGESLIRNGIDGNLISEISKVKR